jgi:ABC-type transport system involved in cytochrome c biogenesis permease subunit
MSAVLFMTAFLAYLAATALALVAVAFSWSRLRRVVLLIGWLGLLAHTVGLGIRWYEAGLVEVMATEKATGTVLTGGERLSVMLSHPPFTNMYESLVFFAWALVLAMLVASLFLRGRRFWLVGVLAMAFSDLTMGLASLSLNREVSPLIPALQSWWLHIHVITAFLAYAAFFLAAAAAVLFLLKSEVDKRTFGIAGAAIGLLGMLALCGGIPRPGGNDATMTLLKQAGACQDWEDCRGDLEPYRCVESRCVSAESCTQERPCPAHHRCEDGRCRLWQTVPVRDHQGIAIEVPLPATTGLMLGVAIVFLLTLAGFFLTRKGLPSWIPGAGLLLGLCGLVCVGVGAGMEGPGLIPPGADASIHLGLRSAPYKFALLVVVFLVVAFVAAVLFARNRLLDLVPESGVLDQAVYRAIQVGFPLMTLGIVTGAVWADYAWGRPWGWDPKETWSLITWIVYAAYLHARITHGWRGKRAAVLAIIGFAVVIFTFLGVNLGLTGSGLHSYGGPYIGD